MAKERFEVAVAEFTKAIELKEQFVEAYIDRAVALGNLKRNTPAMHDLNSAIMLQPTAPGARLRRASFYWQKAAYREAAADLRSVLDSGTEMEAESVNFVAWFFATCPDPSVRDGKLALAMALKALGTAERQNSRLTDTLAAAYATLGDFAKAETSERDALALPIVDPTDKAGMEQRLALYRSHQIYIEAPKSDKMQ